MNLYPRSVSTNSIVLRPPHRDRVRRTTGICLSSTPVSGCVSLPEHSCHRPLSRFLSPESSVASAWDWDLRWRTYHSLGKSERDNFGGPTP